jgi:hypothetical protein
MCASEQETLSRVIFLNDNATQILESGGDPLSPLAHVSCATTLRDIMTGNGRGVFAPDAKSKNLAIAKAYLPSFCITLRREQRYSTSTCFHQTEPAGSSKAQFHWHEGEGQLTLDPVSKWAAESSTRRSVSNTFAYHGLPYLLQPVFQA